MKKETLERWYRTFSSQPVTAMQIMDNIAPKSELVRRGHNPHAIYTALGKELTALMESEVMVDNQWLVIKGMVKNGAQHYQLVPMETDPIQLSIFEYQSGAIEDRIYSGTPNPVYWICEHKDYGKFRTNNLNRFCAEFEIQSSLMSMVARGARKHTCGWTCKHDS